MSNVVMTVPGKLGDAIHQAAIPYWYWREKVVPVHLWLDENSLKPLVPLFEAQPWCASVTLKPGITSYHCGGQPWHFELDTAAYEGLNIFHLGLRGFPQRQLTLECLATANVALDVDPDTLAEYSPFQVEPIRPAKRLVLHGQGVCPHNRSTPSFWKFLARVWPELPTTFDEIAFVGSAEDLEVAASAYPDVERFADDGDFLKLAGFLAGSQAVIGCGSSVVALAQWLLKPTVRVHDPIASASKRIWDGLAKNQLNGTEYELRTEWPPFRERWLEPLPAPRSMAEVEHRR